MGYIGSLKWEICGDDVKALLAGSGWLILDAVARSLRNFAELFENFEHASLAGSSLFQFALEDGQWVINGLVGL